MNAFQIIGLVIGAVVIVVVLWNIRGHRRHGDGKVETFDHHRNTDWLGGG